MNGTRANTRIGGAWLLLLPLLTGAMLLLGGCLAEEGEGLGDGTTGPLVWADISSNFGGCTGCHSGGQVPMLTNCTTLLTETSSLASYSGQLLVNTTTPGDSVLFLVANGTSGEASVASMTITNPTDLLQWINDGANCQ